MQVGWQPSLFAEPTGDDLSFTALRRRQLDDTSWVDCVAGWLAGHDELFARLQDEAPWRQRQRRMYDSVVDEPRLVAIWDGPLPDRLEEMRQTLSERYAVRFDSVAVNFYRDGRDSVAWHGDTVRRRMPEALVATVSLGSRRPFLLRRGTSGPVVARYLPGEGDLIVMGGRCQTDWQHTVPKVRGAGARMSITLRHSEPLG